MQWLVGLTARVRKALSGFPSTLALSADDSLLAVGREDGKLEILSTEDLSSSREAAPPPEDAVDVPVDDPNAPFL